MPATKSLTKRFAAKGARLFCSTRRTRLSMGTPRLTRVRHPVLRAYHAENLAKARAASEELVRVGFNTGDVPYGYRAHRVRVRPPGRRPRWRTRLTVEPVEASTVRMIFVWRVEDRLPVREIQRRLGASRYPVPLDPETGEAGAWTVAIVRAILRNPKYLGRQVWGRHHHGRPTPHAQWVWSDSGAHPPVIDPDTFAAQRAPARHDKTGPGMDSSARTAA
jgi:hypothetical protein